MLNYDPITGILTWRKGRGGYPAGSKAGCLDSKGYIQISINKKKYRAHRIAWALHTGMDPGDLEIDHIDLNKQNNAFSNLRLANRLENCWNRPKVNKSVGSLKNVYFRKTSGKWFSQITVNGKYIYLGTYDSQHLAYKAYCEAANKFHGNFARAK